MKKKKIEANETNTLCLVMKFLAKKVFGLNEINRLENQKKYEELLQIVMDTRKGENFINSDIFFLCGNFTKMETREQVLRFIQGNQKQTVLFQKILSHFENDFELYSENTDYIRNQILNYLINNEEEYLKLLDDKKRSEQLNRKQRNQIMRISLIDYLTGDCQRGLFKKDIVIYNCKKASYKECTNCGQKQKQYDELKEQLKETALELQKKQEQNNLIQQFFQNNLIQIQQNLIEQTQIEVKQTTKDSFEDYIEGQNIQLNFADQTSSQEQLNQFHKQCNEILNQNIDQSIQPYQLDLSFSLEKLKNIQNQLDQQYNETNNQIQDQKVLQNYDQNSFFEENLDNTNNQSNKMQNQYIDQKNQFIQLGYNFSLMNLENSISYLEMQQNEIQNQNHNKQFNFNFFDDDDENYL